MSSKAVAPLVQAECFSSIETILDDARNGRMFILLDDEDRENEGDLVIPAQMVTPRVVNFMAAHGRGLICLCLTSERVAQLGLSPMAVRNDAPHATAFTVSIEARDGVTTGISAADRARTISVAIHASNGPEAIVTPGHVFPLAARDGGVLVRAGHTEAAVDIARLAGLNPSGVICEIMNDDGTMARRDDLIAFAGRYGLHLATIRDLIAYRRRHDRLVEPVSETPFHSEYGGDWRLIRYRNRVDGSEAGVLQMGSVTENRPTGKAAPARDEGDRARGRGPARRIRSRRSGGTVAPYPQLWHRGANPRPSRCPRHDPAEQFASAAGCTRRAWPCHCRVPTHTEIIDLRVLAIRAVRWSCVTCWRLKKQAEGA
jgi:3,4-dihydroxy 2-butanone 4-phosphate synthase/GTP cyclohydrolase II